MAEQILKLKGKVPESITKIEQDIAAEAQASWVRIHNGEICVIYDNKQPQWDTLIKAIREKNLQIESNGFSA